MNELIISHLGEKVVFIAEQSLDEVELILSLCWKIDSSFSLRSEKFQRWKFVKMVFYFSIY